MTRDEILDEEITTLELSVRTLTALRKRFGTRMLIRELAMLNEDLMRAELGTYHKFPNVFVTDINTALAKHGLALGTSWSDMPPSNHAVVRNPQQMCAKRDRETSIRIRETKDGRVFVSIVVSLEGDRARLLLREAECLDQQSAIELALDKLGKSNEDILALPYRD
jgi:hypothetical protein